MEDAVRRRRPAWLVGITYLPFGLFTGFYVVAMPLLLVARGVPLDKVGGITFFILLPTFCSFLLTPLADCLFSRRTWALVFVSIAALCLFGALPLIDRVAAGDVTTFTALLMIGTLAIQMYSSTMGGMTPNLVAADDTATVSAWLNIANLGGVGLGGQLAGTIVGRMGPRRGAIVEGCLVAAPALLLFVLGKEGRLPRRLSETMGRLFKDLWAVSRTRSAMTGLLIFITPSATFAAMNLLSGLGRDFHTSDSVTQMLTGLAGNTVLCSLGAVLGGWLANRTDRRMLFVGTGVVAAFGSLVMAFGPRTPLLFCAGVGFYYLMAGVNYAACSAAAFDIMGEQNPLSATQYALLMASCNLAIWMVTTGDSHGYARFGAKGLLVSDALFSLVTGGVMLALLAKYGGNEREARISAAAPADAKQVM